MKKRPHLLRGQRLRALLQDPKLLGPRYAIAAAFERPKPLIAPPRKPKESTDG